MRAQAEGLKIHSEPFVELFGIPLMYNHSIDDADEIRSFFNTDKVRAPRTRIWHLRSKLSLWTKGDQKI